MRALCGLGIAILVSGCLAAQHRSSAGAAHGGAVASGAHWNGAHFGPRYGRGPALAMVPYAYPIPYAYAYAAAPVDQSYVDSDEGAPAAAGYNQWPGPQYSTAQPPPPPTAAHSLTINMEDMDANPPAEPAHYYIALKDHQVYLAVAYWVASAAEVAVMVTVCVAVRVAGAVYKPVEESVPTAGANDQVTAVLPEPVTCAANCWV